MTFRLEEEDVLLSLKLVESLEPELSSPSFEVPEDVRYTFVGEAVGFGLVRPSLGLSSLV